MRWHHAVRTLLVMILVAAAVTTPTASAAPPTATSDTAAVVFQSTPSSTDRIVCSQLGASAGCDITLSTITSPFACTAEVIQVLGVQPPPFRDTMCNASITGRLAGSTVNGKCSLSNLSGLRVVFNSGVNIVFSGTFGPIGAIFVPVAGVKALTTKATLRVEGIGQLEELNFGTGQIHAMFRVVFTTRLAPDCRSGSGYLIPMHDSAIVIRN